ncbi:ATP-binding protein [Patulibacter americanus]|uniref:ATP-binding protein n=1 Tax=Patulibacter americanus TaxID=588672 RepID=UPI0003B31F46|nr:ATP-binding protein [Patulibacter americanus]
MRCPYGVCDGSGWTVDERTRTATQCRCMPEQRAARVAGSLRARIPREYQDASFEHSNVSGMPRDAVARVRRYVDTLDERLAAGDGLWISGSIGTGKTWLAMLVARYAIERGQAVAVYSVPRLLSEIRRTYDGEGTTTLDLLDQLTEVTLLVLDDVGTERTNPWVLEQLYTIINERWQERRAIVLTTNLDPMQMEAQIGERAVSRLVGMCETVLVDGVDHRQPTPGADRPAGPAHHQPVAPRFAPGVDPASLLGPPPPFDPRDAGPAWDGGAGTGAHAAPAWDGRPVGQEPAPASDHRPGGDDAGELPPWNAQQGATGPSAPATFGADPRDLRRPERRVHGESDGRRRP